MLELFSLAGIQLPFINICSLVVYRLPPPLPEGGASLLSFAENFLSVGRMNSLRI